MLIFMFNYFYVSAPFMPFLSSSNKKLRFESLPSLILQLQHLQEIRKLKVNWQNIVNIQIDHICTNSHVHCSYEAWPVHITILWNISYFS